MGRDVAGDAETSLLRALSHQAPNEYIHIYIYLSVCLYINLSVCIHLQSLRAVAPGPQ